MCTSPYKENNNKEKREASSNRERRVVSWVNNLPEGHSAMLPLIVTEIRKKKAYCENFSFFFKCCLETNRNQVSMHKNSII